MTFRTNIRLYGLVALLLLTACGAKKTSTSENSSGSLTSSHLLADCNTIPANSFNLSGVVSSYYDQASKSYLMDLGRILFTTVPIELSTTDTTYLQIFRWRINESTGQPLYQSAAASLIFVVRSSGQVLNAYSGEQALSRNVISKIISQYNLGNQGINIDNFFSRVMIVASGLSSSDDAYSIALYDTNTGSSAKATIDVLMPSFYANPKTYADTHPWKKLTDLHPFNAFPGLRDTDYYGMANAYCQKFLSY